MAKSQGMVFAPQLRLKPSAALRSRAAVKSSPAPAALRAAPTPIERRLRGLTLTAVLGEPHTEMLRVAVRRSRTAMLCPCGGQAQNVRTTSAERARFGGDSFARAFVCSSCRTRYVGRAKAQSVWPL